MLMFFMGNIIIQDFSNFQQARQKNCMEWHPRGLFAFLQTELWSFVALNLKTNMLCYYLGVTFYIE